MTTWTRAVEVDQIDPEDVLPFSHEGTEYAVYRLEDDSIHVTDGYCTHEQERLCDGLVMDGVIECPKHNGRFDVATGRALGAPVIVDVRTYPTKVEDGVVYVDLS